MTLTLDYRSLPAKAPWDKVVVPQWWTNEGDKDNRLSMMGFRRVRVVKTDRNQVSCGS